MKKIGLVVVLIVAVAVVAGACSVPSDQSAQLIIQEDLAPSLQRVPPTVTGTAPPQTLTREFAYFLLAERPDTEQREVRQVVASIEDGSLFEAIDPMDTEGFKETIGADPALFNVVLRYEIDRLEIDDGVATVFLLTLGDSPDNPVLQQVAAQLVWTLTGVDGVESLRINIDGAPVGLPTTNDDNLTDRPVTIDDYQAYNPQAEVEPAQTTTSTTTTTTTTTTVPPGDS